MLIRKTEPVGVDKIIDLLQVHLYVLNLTKWESYPRAYKNPKRFDKQGFIPEVYLPNGDYKEVFYDDSFNLSTFWVVGENREVGNDRANVPISLIVQANLKELFPLISHRADEELNNLLWDRLRLFTLGAKIETIETSIENVYREFSRTQLTFDDMNEFYVVRFNFIATFESEKKCV